MIRVLLVNDSRTARAAIRAALAGEKDIEIAGELDSAATAPDAVRALEPDVVLMDIMMPGLDGYEATRLLRRSTRVPIIMVSARVSPSDVAVAMDALRAGAIGVLEAPSAPDDPRYEIIRRTLALTIRSAAALPRTKPVQSSPNGRSAPASEPAGERRTFAALGIVASLGGPPVVAEILGALPADHPPVLLVQHIEASFVVGFVDWLRTSTRSAVEIARTGTALERGTIYVAPPDQHLSVTADRRALVSSAPPVNGFRPSANVLLSALALAFGRDAGAVVLTGMGRDGAEGARKLHDAGGFVIAQDEASCAVAGMPNAARAAGAVDVTLSPSAIAGYLR